MGSIDIHLITIMLILMMDDGTMNGGTEPLDNQRSVSRLMNTRVKNKMYAHPTVAPTKRQIVMDGLL
jgi:hypothetical protein